MNQRREKFDKVLLGTVFAGVLVAFTYTISYMPQIVVWIKSFLL